MKTIRQGITLMEVLASTFVIGIGLLGVLAVIPFGAFQVSKARDAEQCANMLDAAAGELFLAEMVKPTSWKIHAATPNVNLYDNERSGSSGGTEVYRNTSSDGHWINCTRFYLVDPFEPTGTINDFDYVFRVGAHFDREKLWQERMRGQDDLLYTIHDARRTDFAVTSNRATSSGKYTWFFTFLAKDDFPIISPDNDNKHEIDWADVSANVAVDLLGCYNRTPGMERMLTILTGDGTNNKPEYFDNYASNMARIRLQGTTLTDLDLSKTRYLFIAWSANKKTDNTQISTGGWFKILNSLGTDSDSGGFYRDVFVQSVGSATLPDLSLAASNAYAPQALVIDGVLYHKSVADVPLR